MNTKKNFYCLALLPFYVLTIASCDKGHSHSYDFANPTWSWVEDEDKYTASVVFECTGCGSETKEHFLNLDATVSETKVNPTCEVEGSITYTATATYQGKAFSDTKVESLDKLGHNFETITVSGNYSTSYNALDYFDTQNIVVQGICSRDGCHKSVTLNTDEYFVIYQSAGADHLSAGDTKVTISSSYAPFARFEITGLTVNKIPNAISGMETSYETACHTVPDLKGVIALSGGVQIKYFTDEQCKNEIQLEDISAGTYYIKAIAGDQNYEFVEKKAVLTAKHIFNQCVVGSDYLYTGATNFDNAMYYKSCTCGEKSASTNDVFEEHYSKLPDMVSKSALLDYSVINEIAPEGYEYVTKSNLTYEDKNQGFSFIDNLDLNAIEEKVRFKMLTKNRSFCDSSWGASATLAKDTWYDVEIVKNVDLTYSSFVRDETGKTLISYLAKPYVGYYLNESIRSTVLPYYNIDGDAAPMEIYTTEVYGQRYDNETFNDFIAGGTLNTYEQVEMISPKGYKTVTKGTFPCNDNNQGKPFMADLAIEKYESVSFMFLTKNRYLTDRKWGSALKVNVWYCANLTRNPDGTYDIDIADTAGDIKFTYKNQTSFRNSILYYNGKISDDAVIWYSTEVRGVLRKDIPLTTVVIDSCAYSANGIVTSPSSEAAPIGFENVRTWSSETEGSLHGKFFSNQVLTNYSKVTFAIKTSGYFLFNGWSNPVDNYLWTIIELTNNNNNTWNIKAYNLEGNELHSATNLSDVKEGSDVYTNHALNTLLYGNPATGYMPYKKSGVALAVSVTELRGTLK